MVIKLKQPKKLTRDQKEQLTREGLDATQYVIISEDDMTFTVQKKNEIGPQYQTQSFMK